MSETFPTHFTVEPWKVRELGLHVDKLAQSESVFALANGHIGVRGNFDEGDPFGLLGTYLNSFYENRPLPYAEAGYGYPEVGQTIVNVTDGKLIRLLVDDEPFDLRYGVVHHHERTLDMKRGVLTREVLWETPTRKKVKVTSTRLVSFTQRAMLGIQYKVEAVDEPIRIVIQSELVADEEVPVVSKDPRVAAALEQPLVPYEHSASNNRALLMHHTKTSNLRLAVACDHVLHGPFDSHTYAEDDWARTTVGTELEPGESAGLTKFVAYGWSSRRTWASLRDQVDGSLSTAVHTGWETLLAEQQEYVQAFWDVADVEIDGDPVIQQAVRFGLWHTLQAGARAEGRAIAAKGLTGPGYDGHAFWDTEAFVLPVLSATAPLAAHDALVWRRNCLPEAREHATDLGFTGAAFPWRTIRGQECSGYWPAGMAAMHINADVALAAARHVHWTADEGFDKEVALPILVETARLWMALGFFGDDGKFHINGVTGPDEYSACMDDNAFTNLAAARNLRYAADAVERHPNDHDYNISSDEIASWRAASDAIALPYDEERGMYEQAKNSTQQEIWDFEKAYTNDLYPLLLHNTYFDLYRKQVVKQADLALAMQWFGDEFTREEKAKSFAYYEGVTVRDSSLSACTQAILAADVDQLDLANRYLREAALMDLRDLEHNTKDGVHVASLAGAWLALVCGFGGMRDYDGHLSFAPVLPPGTNGMRFAVQWQSKTIRVHVGTDHVRYSMDTDGENAHVELSHNGKKIRLSGGESVTKPLRKVQPLTPEPTQPVGREPIAPE